MKSRSARRVSSRCLAPRCLRAALWAGAAVLLLARPAHAYLDPGSGSFLLQMLAGVILGVGVTLKIYWRKLTAALRRRRDPAEPRDDS